MLITRNASQVFRVETVLPFFCTPNSRDNCFPLWKGKFHCHENFHFCWQFPCLVQELLWSQTLKSSRQHKNVTPVYFDTPTPKSFNLTKNNTSKLIKTNGSKSQVPLLKYSQFQKKIKPVSLNFQSYISLVSLPTFSICTYHVTVLYVHIYSFTLNWVTSSTQNCPITSKIKMNGEMHHEKMHLRNARPPLF